MRRTDNRMMAPCQTALPVGRSVTNIQARARSELALLAGLELVVRALQGHEEWYITELAVLSRALDGIIPGVAGSVVAGALIDAARPPDLRELPADGLRQFRPTDNPLEILAGAGGIAAPGDVLRAGLPVLTALVKLGEIKVASSSRRAA